MLPLVAGAQLAPVMGDHYAARASDTGFQGAVNSTGGYSASVPLDLPAVRGGIPVPLQVVYGGNQVGAAGLGWDVPLSYVFISSTLAHHRPVPDVFSVSSTTAPIPPLSYSVTLAGESTDLVRNAADTAWVGRRGNTQIEVRDIGGGGMVMYDGEGRTYNFSSEGGSAGSRLIGGSLYLLRNITDSSANKVHLEYDFGAPALPGGGTGLSIDLASVTYNYSPTTTACAKNQVLLNYDAPVTAPLAMSIMDGAVLARMHKLDKISVNSRATCTDSPVSMRRYDFTYRQDTDTQRPQLQKVTMIGQQGTPERNITLPVAEYLYGSISNGSGNITYQKTQSIDASATSNNISYTAAINFEASVELLTQGSFVDVNGDGRPDFATPAGVQLNIPGDSGTTTFSPPDQTPLEQPRSLTVNISNRYASGPSEVDPMRSEVESLSQFIDMDGDGVVDFVDAFNNRTIIQPWKFSNKLASHTIPTEPMQLALGLPAGSEVPLSKSTTLETQGALQCFRWAGASGDWIEDPGSNCLGYEAAVAVKSPQVTIVQWELRDINGDGYPDLVYDTSPIPSTPSVPSPLITGTEHEGERRLVRGPSVPLSGPRDVKVLFNSAGVHLGAGSTLFHSPTSLDVGGCGLGRWETAPGAASSAVMYQTCGFEDVNGDGIADRITSVVQPDGNGFVSQAVLGTGNPNGFYDSHVTITLPGALARVDTDLVNPDGKGFVPRSCNADGTGSFDVLRTQSLRDINGDGIPDYLAKRDGAWSVNLGTGTGFAPTVFLTMPAGLEIAKETNTCQKGFRFNVRTIIAGTPMGLYDLDGDGQPEILASNTDTRKLDVYQLKPPVDQFGRGNPLDVGLVASVPAAGRLVAITDGYGAFTRIGYRSAKEDTHGQHNVPYPEIVVAAVATTDNSSERNPFTSTIRYAYGNAGLIFDSAYDTFIFPGYQRSVTLRDSGDPAKPAEGMATLTDTYGLAPFNASMDAPARFKRNRKTGHVSDVTTIGGTVGTDPWALLGTDITKDPRRISGAHYDWDARLLASGPAAGSNESCVDMVFPYDFDQSNQNSTGDECVKHGFIFQKSSFSWRGTPGTADAVTSQATVQTSSTVDTVDDFGRVVSVRQDNDMVRSDDDLCFQTAYAMPTGSNERVLNAPVSRTTTNCISPTVLARKTWEYDTGPGGVKLPAGKVSKGLVTGYIASRLDASGAGIPDESHKDIRLADVSYDNTGNPLSVIKTRDDGAKQSVTTIYDDAFGLVPVTVTVDATNADNTKPPAMTSTATFDKLTLNVLSATDPNGAIASHTYDGFGRALLSKVTPTGGTEGVLSSMTYLGFAATETGGRRVLQKVFTDPVAVANVATATGRTGTVFLDALGREQHTEVQLGADYVIKTLIADQRTYDLLGRVLFEADPFPSTDSFGTAYGTTHHYNTDGTPSCSIRSKGFHAFTATTDEANEVYPTCVSHMFGLNREYVYRSDATSLVGGPSHVGQMFKQSSYSAIGRLIENYTFQFDANFNGIALEDASFDYDALGHLRSMSRFKDPKDLVHSPKVTTTWHTDSLGWVTELDDADSAAQFRVFDSWGELTQTQWNDATITPATDRRSITQYDALGRIVHGEEQSKKHSDPVTKYLADNTTLNNYAYDTGVNTTTPPVTATNVLGRLAKASSPTSTVAFSYDGLGRVNAQTFIDISTANVYVEKHDTHGDGSAQTLHLLLPDNAFKDEKVDYVYDSAGRTRSVKYNDGVNQDLFTATGSTDLDVFGRIRQAQYGLATFTASYADAGRRLLTDVKVTSSGTPAAGTFHTREIAYPAISNGSMNLTPFDPVGRERSRNELIDGDSKTLAFAYDPIGQLVSTTRTPVPQSVPNLQLTYDALGNMLTQSPSTGTSGVTLTYQGSGDLDRICSIGYGATPPPTACNVTYDGMGNIVSQPARSGTRKLTYYASGLVKSIANGSTNATFKYDAFGAVQQMTLNTTSADVRHDKHFGGLLTQRDEGGTSVLTRTIPAPGLVATRHGPNGTWTFAFDEGRGTRFVTDQSGAFVQDMDYQAYGETTCTPPAFCPTPGTKNYTSEQWNGGDALSALGVSQLGARIYDPVIGRFLSRDPLIIPRTAATTNPYAFAMNDPVNRSDPSGLDPKDPESPPKKCENCVSVNIGFGWLVDYINAIGCQTSGCGADTANRPGGSAYVGANDITYDHTGGTGQSKSYGSGANGFPVQPLGYTDDELRQIPIIVRSILEALEKHSVAAADNQGLVNVGLGPLKYVLPGAALADRIQNCSGGLDAAGCLPEPLERSTPSMDPNKGHPYREPGKPYDPDVDIERRLPRHSPEVPLDPMTDPTRIRPPPAIEPSPKPDRLF